MARVSEGQGPTAETEKGTPTEMTSEGQPAEGGAGRVAGAQGGAEPVATHPCPGSRVPSPARQLARSACGISALGEKLITNTNQPCFFLLSPAPERCREWAGPLAGCTGNHTGET